MNEKKQHPQFDDTVKEVGAGKGEISRRQFLTYTLMGTAGFMASMLITPPLRATLDSVLQKKQEEPMVAVADVNELTNEPKRFTFTLSIDDAWVKNQQTTFSAWVYKKENGDIVALSPICTHLGCTVDWDSNPKYPNEFFCPCHGGRYTKDGVNIPGTPPPAPLAEYAYEVKDGKLYLGNLIPRT